MRMVLVRPIVFMAVRTPVRMGMVVRVGRLYRVLVIVIFDVAFMLMIMFVGAVPMLMFVHMISGIGWLTAAECQAGKNEGDQRDLKGSVSIHEAWFG